LTPYLRLDKGKEIFHARKLDEVVVNLSPTKPFIEFLNVCDKGARALSPFYEGGAKIESDLNFYGYTILDKEAPVVV